MNRLAGLTLAGLMIVLVAVVAAGCGDRSSLDYTLGDGGYLVEGSLPPGCGDGTCSGGETCTSCSVDCGVCKSCGNHSCERSLGEDCNSCPEDCGVCATCGDGFCNGTETCENCAPDCGKCPGCGDGVCQAPKEDCFACPEDCGKCKGCGDGLCQPPETCASCAPDCGVCAVCGNGKCEPPYETCTNCHEDCGDCQTIGCLEMLTCAFKCIDTSTNPPNVSVTCVADCVSRGCPSAQFFFDQAFNCFLQNLNKCQPVSITCLEKQCDAQVAACIGGKCPPAGG
ncbi:MAG TPA: hypothetical protein VIF15_19970 [Polyangiaceae bacterium]